jgi:nucleoid DNA-binding protein
MPNLTKRELVTRISDETGIVQRRVLHVIDRLLEHLIDSMAHGQTVEFRNFGIFEVKLRKARVGRDPHHPENLVPIPARHQVRFKAGKILKAKVMNQAGKSSVSDAIAPELKKDDSLSQRLS